MPSAASSFSIPVPYRRRWNRLPGVWLCLILFSANPPLLSQKGQSEEKQDYYRRWLEEDVVYIITEEEREVFKSLSTSLEKDRFIEQFWMRRDPDPSTAVNEFKEEHYRRITYANEHFRSGIDGWATDRGRIYIRFGEPDSIERHPTGGRYDRPLSEGGGSTTTFPYEVWTYNQVLELGREMRVEFVDPLGTGEYRIALDDSEKDALLYVPGQGRTLAEIAGLETRVGRVRNALHLRNLGLAGDSPLRAGDDPFTTLEKYFALRRPPEFRFPELERVVETRVSYNSFPVAVSVHRYWMSQDQALVAVTLHVPAAEVIQGEGSQVRVDLDFYGRVETMSGKRDYEFEDQLWIPQPKSVQEFVYQKKIPLKPGRYKLSLVIREPHSGRLATRTEALLVPRNEGLTLSDVAFSERLVGMQDETLVEPFTTRTGLKVYPVSARSFRPGQRLAFFFEVYNFVVDSASGQPEVEWDHAIVPAGTSWEETPLHLKAGLGRFSGALTAAQFFSTEGLEPGDYLLRIEVADRIQQASQRCEVPFRIE